MNRKREKSNFKPFANINNYRAQQNSKPFPNQSSYPKPNTFNYPKVSFPPNYQKPINPQIPFRRPEIKQEPRSQTGFRQNVNNFTPNTHEQCYAFPPGTPPFQFPPYPPYPNPYPVELYPNLYYPQSNEKTEENGEQGTDDVENQEETNLQSGEEQISDEINFLMSMASNEQT